MNTQIAEFVVHHWGFYSSGRLALGAKSRRVGHKALVVHVLETRWYVESVSLPERLGLENTIRSLIRSDLESSVGPDWAVTIRFEPGRVPESRLVRHFMLARTSSIA